MKRTKSFWTAGLAVLAVLLVLPSMASADHNNGRRSQGSCSRCGQQTYAVQVLVGYDRCGNPIFAWAPAQHRCSSHGHSSYHRQSNYPSRGYYGNSCPDRGYSNYGRGSSYGSRGYSSSRGGVSITFGF